MKKIIYTGLILSSCLSYAQQEFSNSIEVPFQLSDGGHIIIKAQFDGVEGTFIFDTGAGLNLITKKFADKVKTLRRTNEFYTGHRATGEALTLDLWKVNVLDIGGFEQKESFTTVMDIDFPLDGLISLTPFRNHPVTIDYKNRILIVESQSSLQEKVSKAIYKQVPIQITNDRDKSIDISTYVQLNDTLTLQVGLDTGAGFNVYRFNSRYINSLGLDSRTMKSEYKKSSFDPKSGNIYYFTELSRINVASVDQIDVEKFSATFIDGLIYEGIMGMHWLGDQITINVSDEYMLIK